jgi:hypothetical protein
MCIHICGPRVFSSGCTPHTGPEHGERQTRSRRSVVSSEDARDVPPRSSYASSLIIFDDEPSSSSMTEAASSFDPGDIEAFLQSLPKHGEMDICRAMRADNFKSITSKSRKVYMLIPVLYDWKEKRRNAVWCLIILVRGDDKDEVDGLPALLVMLYCKAPADSLETSELHQAVRASIVRSDPAGRKNMIDLTNHAWREEDQDELVKSLTPIGVRDQASSALLLLWHAKAFLASPEEVLAVRGIPGSADGEPFDGGRVRRFDADAAERMRQDLDRVVGRQQKRPKWSARGLGKRPVMRMSPEAPTTPERRSKRARSKPPSTSPGLFVTPREELTRMKPTSTSPLRSPPTIHSRPSPLEDAFLAHQRLRHDHHISQAMDSEQSPRTRSPNDQRPYLGKLQEPGAISHVPFWPSPLARNACPGRAESSATYPVLCASATGACPRNADTQGLET